MPRLGAASRCGGKPGHRDPGALRNRAKTTRSLVRLWPVPGDQGLHGQRRCGSGVGRSSAYATGQSALAEALYPAPDYGELSAADATPHASHPGAPDIVLLSLKVLEERQELVVRPVPPQPARRRGGLCKDFFLQREVRVQVDLRGLDRFVPEPQGDEGELDARQQ